MIGTMTELARVLIVDSQTPSSPRGKLSTLQYTFNNCYQIQDIPKETIKRDTKPHSKLHMGCWKKLCSYHNRDSLWLLVWDYNMLIIFPRDHDILRVYYCNLLNFMVCLVIFFLFGRYYGISGVTVSTYAFDCESRFGCRHVVVYIQ